MEFTLNFTNMARYKRAVKALWSNPKYRLLVYGRNYVGLSYGYVTFTAI